MTIDVLEAARRIRDERFANADVVLAAGSIVRGEGTAHSDIDLVVLLPELDAAYRESFRAHGYPVEAFVHDMQTIRYFCLEMDRPGGVPALPQMIMEGVAIPEPNEASGTLKEFAASILAMGPPVLSDADLDRLRYMITDSVDDLRTPRSREELIGTGAQLYEALANFALRSRGAWSGKGKSIPRALANLDPSLRDRYRESFEDLFVRGEPRSVVELAAALLEPFGGFLFEGYRLEAPREWRLAPDAASEGSAV